MRSAPWIVLTLLASSFLPAQQKTPRGAMRPAAAAEKVEIDVWNETRSRQLFAACDEDADDSLDLFETCAAFELPIDAPALERFRRLDRNRDGFLDWSEFDRYCGGVVYDGHTLRLWLCRPLPADEKEQQPAAPATPAQTLLQLFDTDRSGDMSRTEFAALLTRANLPAVLAGKFATLDADGSKTLSSTELAPLLQLGAPFLSTLQAKSEGLPLLPPPYASWDRDTDGSLDAQELAAALRRIDPEIAHFAAEVLDRLDSDRDQKVGAAELEARSPSAGRAVVERTPRR